MSLDLPLGCITANALRSLASAMDRLHAFHKSRGGAAPDDPCLKSVSVDNGEVTARIVAGNVVTYRLVLHQGAWEFR